MPLPLPYRRVLHRVLLLVIAFNLLLLAYYICVDYQYVFHSDSAAANLLAQEMRETGHFFPPAWNYVNSDLWLLYMQVYVVPLLKFFPNGYPLHAVVSAISAVLVLWASWLLARVAGLSSTAQLAVLAVFSAGLSPNTAENLYGQAAYGTMFYSGCVLLYCSWRYLQPHGRRRWLWAVAAMAMALTLFWANPQRAAVYYGMPLAVGTLALYWRGRRDASVSDAPSWQRALALVAALALIAVTGALLHAHTLRHVNGSAGLTQAQWLDFENMLINAGGTLQGLISLLSGLPPPGGAVMNLPGAVFGLRLLAGLVLLVVLPWALTRSLNWREPGRLFVASGALCTIAVCLFINLTTSIPVQATPEASVRYVLTALLAILILAIGAIVDWRGRAPQLRMSGLAALAVLVLTAPAVYFVPEAPRYLEQGDKHVLSYKWRLLDYLKSQGLQYGYSNFWSAGQTTVLSDGAVRARQIEVVNGMPQPRRHLASDRWYLASAWQGETFLMLNKEEMDAVNWPRLLALTGEPKRRLTFEGWQILVYDHNIAADLPAWDANISKPIRYPLGTFSAHLAGHFNPDSGALEAQAGQPGVLLFGPGQRVPAGAYQVTFDIESDGASGDNFGALDVVSINGKAPHATQAITRAGRQQITLNFDLPHRADGMEFRVVSSGAGALKVYSIELARRAPTLASNTSYK